MSTMPLIKKRLFTDFAKRYEGKDRVLRVEGKSM